MRIQETNAIMKEGQIRRLDNGRSSRHEQEGAGMWRRLLSGKSIVPLVGGVIALVAAAGASIFFVMRKHPKNS